MDPMNSIESGKNESTAREPHPPLRDLFIAEEQPGEANATALRYLNAHPEVRRFIERQKTLERMADYTDPDLGLRSPDFDTDDESDVEPSER